MPDHPFWFVMTVACLVWYSLVTIYVTFKASGDIREMVRRLASRRNKS